jgi:hypothetical protein
VKLEDGFPEPSSAIGAVVHIATAQESRLPEGDLMTMNSRILAIAAALVLVGTAAGFADGPAPPTDVVAADRPNDAGNALIVTWKPSPDDVPGAEQPAVIGYAIARQAEGDSDFVPAGEATAGATQFVDGGVERSRAYLYRVTAIGPDDARSEPAESTVAVTPQLQVFNMSRAWFGVILLAVCGAIIYFILAARRGRAMHVRRIPGLEAVTDAVGRATEMGRSCLFVPGILDINDIQTIAGITVLSRVATIAAEYDAKVEVPTARSLVMTTARETVESAYLAAGRPDAYNPDQVYYVTDEQFGYVASVAGSMVRDKPAACFYMGSFYAESLILAETGNSIGAIQIAGTGQPSQLPFFVAACDFTLIGEEFLAASAYLSGEPQQLGSLKGQDAGKVLGTSLLVIGSLLATAASVAVLMSRDDRPLKFALKFLQSHVLGSEGFLP